MKLLFQRLQAELLDLFTGADDLAAARAKHLQANIVIALFGSLGTSIALVFFMWRDDLKLPLIIWLICSHIPALIRLWLWRAYAVIDFEQNNNHILANFYLRISTLATLIAGIVFGLGWGLLVPYVEVNAQLIYLLAVIALLFGGLYTYSPNFITYLVFSISAIWLVPFISIFVTATQIENFNFFILLISLLSTMFGMRFSLSFQHNHQLRKNIEHLLEEVTQKHKEALEAISEKSKFLASVSHDLRQPMHAISLNVATISSFIDQEKLNSAHIFFLKEQTNRLTGNVNYLNEMFSALLDMSKLEAGITSVSLQPISLSVILDRIKQEFIPISEDLNLSFSVKCTLPENICVMADRNALERVLRNLISNAFKNSFKGGVRLSLIHKENLIQIRVIDTGLGIPKNVREKIFQEFFQIQSENITQNAHLQFGHSFGLGLAIARRLAERMNSKINCHSWEKVGSVFSISLPVVQPIPIVANNFSLSSSHILDPDTLIVIIDDDIQILESTSAFLKIHEINVITAVNGADAVNKLRDSNKKPDLLISDFRLLGETGINAINLVREEFNFDIPGLIITGETQTEDILDIRLSGYNILFKPLSINNFIQTITNEIKNNAMVSVN